jgi:phenylpyruvate tautomerase PptA (4-oxalocrotonate tautomerase family)
MPIVRVDIPYGYTDAHKERLRQGIKDAIDQALDPAQRGRHPGARKWIYVSVHEALGKIGDGLPTVTVDTRPGRSQEQKDLCAKLICDVFEVYMDTRDVYVLLRTTEAVDHLTGADTLPEWKS